MRDEIRRIMVRHGAVVTLIGALSGLVYTMVISGDVSGGIRAWHVAHLQGVMTGMLMIAVSSFASRLTIGAKACRVMAVSFIITGYCYALGPVWGAMFGVRGLEPAMPITNVIMFISNTAASISVLVGLVILITGTGKNPA